MDDISTIRNIVVRVGADVAELQKGLASASGKMDKFGKSMGKTGMSLTKNITAPIVGIGTAAIMTLSKFDDSMSKVQAISGATEKDMASLRDMAKDLGSKTKFAASEAADAMSYLALAGWDTNQILSATPDMLSLAAAGGMDLATAADIVSDTMSAFQMEAEKAGQAADIFAAASSKSNTNITQLGEAMKFAAPAANAAGMDLAKTSAILGVLADSGIKGSMAGTTFNAMLKDMRGSAKEGSLSVGKMKIALYDSAGAMRDMGSVMADVERATDGMTTAQRDAAMGAIFGEKAIKGVNIMLATGSERYRELETAMYNSAGSAQKMAETMENNIGGAFRTLKSQTEGILIDLGEQLAPLITGTLIPIVKDFGNGLSNLIKWFSGLDDNTKQIILKAILLAAALGPILIIGAKIVSAVSFLISVFVKLGAFIGFIVKVFAVLKGVAVAVGIALGAISAPVWIVIGAVAALIAIGVAMWKYWDNIKAFFVKLWDTIKSKVVEVINYIKPFITTALESIKTAFSNIGNAIKNVFLGAFKAMASGVKMYINMYIGFINGMIRGVTAGFNLLVNLANKIPKVNLSPISAPQIPKLAKGTNYIPQDGPYFLHRGEQVKPKAYVDRDSKGNKSIVNNFYITENSNARETANEIVRSLRMEGVY